MNKKLWTLRTYCARTWTKCAIKVIDDTIIKFVCIKNYIWIFLPRAPPIQQQGKRRRYKEISFWYFKYQLRCTNIFPPFYAKLFHLWRICANGYHVRKCLLISFTLFAINFSVLWKLIFVYIIRYFAVFCCIVNQIYNSNKAWSFKW